MGRGKAKLEMLKGKLVLLNIPSNFISDFSLHVRSRLGGSVSERLLEMSRTLAFFGSGYIRTIRG